MTVDCRLSTVDSQKREFSSWVDARPAQFEALLMNRMSVRRFEARPSEVLLLAMGLESPLPRAVTRGGRSWP